MVVWTDWSSLKFDCFFVSNSIGASKFSLKDEIFVFVFDAWRHISGGNNEIIRYGVLSMNVGRMRKHPTIVAKNMGLDRTHCCCQVSPVVLIEGDSSRRDM